MYHPKMERFDRRMKALFDRIDDVLEDRYAGTWTLRRNRPRRGEAANPEADGLFNVGVFFDPGFDPDARRGYLVEIILATGQDIPDERREEIRNLVRSLLERYLPEHFPERRLMVDLEGGMLKIHGDLSLGDV